MTRGHSSWTRTLSAALALSTVVGSGFALAACSNPEPGPDKTLAGAVLGAGWGAGAGAVIGHQVSYAGEGVAVGSGFGAVGGALTGAGFDLTESVRLDQEKQLASLRVQNLANTRSMENVQDRLDDAIGKSVGGGFYQVFFDEDATNLRSGAVANLEVIAETLKTNPRAYKIHVVGHSDDNGNPEYNQRLAESRARAVSAYLGSRGISMDQIFVSSHGSQRPIASNGSQVGRQLNRRVDVYIEHSKG